METIGSRIFFLRKKRGISQKILGNLLGVSSVTVLKWEKDINVPKHESLALLAGKLDTTIDYILYGTTENNLNPAELLAQQLKQLANDGKLSSDDIGLLNNTLQHLVKLKESKDAVANGTAPDKKSA